MSRRPNNLEVSIGFMIKEIDSILAEISSVRNWLNKGNKITLEINGDHTKVLVNDREE